MHRTEFVIEFCKNVLAIENASSTETNPNTTEPIIDLMPEQKKVTKKGGTMRLGAYDCDLKRGSLASKCYKSLKISERHRHRYEFNNKYLDAMESKGLIASGKNAATNLVEIVELKGHPWFIGVQFHPELKSTVENPHPLFVGFVKACIDNKK